MTQFQATVPHYWIRRFIGHRIWFRPDGVADCEWRELIDVSIQPTKWGSLVRGWVWHNGQLKSGNLAQKTTVLDVPKEECIERVIKEGKREYRWWEWQPPEGKCPPDIPVREPDWRPKGYPVTVTPAAPSEDGALFNL